MNLKKYLVICICLLFIAFSFNILSKYSTVSGENLSLNNIDNEIANNEEAENLKIEYEKLQTRIKNEEMIEINRVEGLTYLRENVTVILLDQNLLLILQVLLLRQRKSMV